ncbi:hypothetical protein BDF20DRAFT_838839 [Mycotypha africana]|uniref:uncharacterized protein n=1 Tax=Mycotypha africana TaxID=64632 RepID=UPI002301D28C|nr:uncharacterized protein BDF20DRAFT_838839 [Mycotypha africana]KAI8970491.1 hypothetical protein BDF20DRAFT_838839 [Mycotypha africana]
MTPIVHSCTSISKKTSQMTDTTSSLNIHIQFTAMIILPVFIEPASILPKYFFSKKIDQTQPRSHFVLGKVYENRIFLNIIIQKARLITDTNRKHVVCGTPDILWLVDLISAVVNIL